MSKGLSSVKTLTAKEIAKKWNLSLKDVSMKIAAGVKVEKEHTKSTRQANEIARDHLGERPDYYDKLGKMEKTKIVKEMDTSRMPFSKNIEDRRPTTGQDWQSRILKAGSYVSGAIGDIKNATIGPDKPDMNLGKKAEPLNTGRPATPAKEGSTGDGRKEYGRFEDDPRSGEGYRTQTPGSWNKYTDSIASQGSSGRGTPGPVTPGSKGGSITTPKPPESKLEPEDVWHGGFNAKAKQPVVKEQTGVTGVRGLGYVSGDPSGTNYVEKYVNTNAMSYQDVNGDKLKFIEKSHRKLHDRKLGFKEYDPRNIRTSSNKDLAEANLNELGGDYDRSSQGVDVIGDLTGASRKIAKIDEIKSKLKGRQMKEDKDPCWKGYEMIGMKKKKGRTVPNCVPKEEKNLVPAGSTERGIYETQVDEVAMAMPPQIEPPSITRPAPAKQFSRSVRPSGRMGSGAGAMRGGVQVQRAAPARPISARMNPSQGGSMTAQVQTQRAAPMRGITSTMPSRGTGPNAMSAKPTVSGGGLNKSEFMGRSMSSKMTDGLDKVSRGMSKAIAPAAEKSAAVAGSALSKSLGAVARVAGGPAATAAMAVMEPTPAGEKQSEFQRQDMMKKYNPFKSQGRSIADYEKQQVTRKSASAPTAAEAPKPKADVPTPPSRPEYFTRGQAFGAARKEAGGGEGKFSYQSGSDTAPKTYQSNVKGEPYKPESQLKQTSVKEETKMNTKELINEALDNIVEDNLVDMKENFMAALQEKAMEKLEERKKIIASDYFAQ